MGWRYRKRIKILPGIHINISKSGISTNIGVKGASVTFGPKGTYVNTGIPGTGLYRRDQLSVNHKEEEHINPSSFYISPTIDKAGKSNYKVEKSNGIITKLIGGVLLCLSFITVISFISYFCTADVDQSLIENPMSGDFLNAKREFQNICGSWGAYTSYFLIAQCFGYSAILIPIFIMVVSFNMMSVYKLNLLKWFFSLMIIMIWCSVGLAAYISPLLIDSVFNAGGKHGAYIAMTLENNIGTFGLTAILVLLAVFFLIYIISEKTYFVRSILNPLNIVTDKVESTITNHINEDEKDKSFAGDENKDEVYDTPASQVVNFDVNSDHAKIVDEGYDIDDEETKSVQQAGVTESSEDVGYEVETGTQEEVSTYESSDSVLCNLPSYDPRAELSHYRFPTLYLLKKYENDLPSFIDTNEQHKNKDRIVQVLKNFGVTVDSIKATVGPTITLYEITLAPGINASKMRGLEDNIALALCSHKVQFIIPIPSKGTIGIEVPNARPSIVSMESILSSKKFQETTMALPCALGKTLYNEVFMFDLSKAPHILIGGSTGQGKSVTLNAIITSLLYKKHPAEIKLVLMDSNGLEFSLYSRIANSFLAALPDGPTIISDSNNAVDTLNSICQEMDDRYSLLKYANVRKLDEYNEKFVHRQLNPKKGHRYLPYIVVIIDEYGNFIEERGTDIEIPITQLAQFGRAVGIHMIISTKRPTNDIITGKIKSNFPTRISFRVPERIDSQVILDSNGAEELLGNGDMLFKAGKSIDCIRVQGAFVDTPEVIAINKFISEQQGYNEPFELPEPIFADNGGISNTEDLDNLDPLFGEAARVIINTQQGSTSIIQRKFSIGYNRAGRLMNQLEKAGVVGAARGSISRDVLIQDEETLQSLLNTLGV